MKQLNEIKSDKSLLNAIDWEMTPEEAVRLYLEWGNNWARGNYVIRSKDDVSHYFVVNTWKEVLQHDDVGIHDNYFDLGGTSFDILRINGKLKEIFRIDIPLVSMFTYPTVHSFAVYLENIRQDKVPEIRDRADLLERSKLDRKQLLQRRKGSTE